MKKIEDKYPQVAQKEPLFDRIWSVYKANYKFTIPTSIFVFYVVTGILIPSRLLTYNAALILIDQRISNYVTMTSMTLAVFGFLLSNLIKKDSFNYELLYKKSGFIPIIYFVFLGIGSFLAISTSRDIIKSLNGPSIYGKLVISSTILMLVGLYLVFSLFKKILDFTSEEKIMFYIEKDILFHLKLELLDVSIKDESQKILSEFLNNHGVDGFYGVRIPQGEYTIHDVDVHKLGRYISEDLNFVVPANLYINSANISIKKEKIKASAIKSIGEICVVTKTIENNREFANYLNHIGRELDKSISEANSINLTRVYRVFDKMLDRAAVFHDPVYLGYVEFVYIRTNKSINRLIEKGNFDLLGIIFQQIEVLLTTCAKRENASYFTWICDCLSWSYAYTSDRFSKGDIPTKVLESVFTMTIKSFERVLTYNIYFQVSTRSRIKLYEGLFTSICTVARRAISNKNKDHLTRSIAFINGITNIGEIENLYEIRSQLRSARIGETGMEDQDREEFLKKSIVTPSVGYYQRHTKILIGHWIMWMRENERLTNEEMESFLEVLGDQILWLDDLVKLTQDIGYFERRNWYFGDIGERDRFNLGNTDWIYHTFLVEKLRKGDYRFKTLEIDEEIKAKFIDNLTAARNLKDLWRDTIDFNTLGIDFEKVLSEIRK